MLDRDRRNAGRLRDRDLLCPGHVPCGRAIRYPQARRHSAAPASGTAGHHTARPRRPRCCHHD
jgi:hypothetical protein